MFTMSSSLWNTCLLLLTVAGSSSASILSIRTEISSNVVALTKAVTFKCIVEKEHYGTTSRVEIGKTLVDESNGEAVFQLVNEGGSVIKVRRFDLLSRYELNLQQDGNNDVYILRIADLEVEDNADLFCREVTEDLYSVESFQVKSIPENAQWDNNNDTNKDIYMSGEEVDFREDEESSLRCTISGGSPAPEVLISSQGHDYSAVQEDDTEFFQRKVQSSIICGQQEWDDDEYCFMHRKYQTTYTTSTFHPLPEHHNHELECKARVPGTDPYTTSTAIVINLTFKPHFSSSNNHLEADVGEQNVVMGCGFEANPSPTEVWWVVDEDGQSYKLDNGDTTPSGQIHATVSLIKQEMSLKFVEVVKQHHKTQTYYAVAINDMGRTDYPMYITEVGAPHPGSASLCTGSVLAMLTVALIVQVIN